MNNFIEKLYEKITCNDKIENRLYEKYNVKRGLRNADGTGVLVGLTTIGDVQGYIIREEDKEPIEGKLIYRGIDVEEIVKNCIEENRFGFEETCYLLLFGTLPNKQDLEDYNKLIAEAGKQGVGFIEDLMLNSTGKNIMNKIAKGILGCYGYDDDAENTDVKNVLRQSIDIIARFPILTAYAYQSKIHYYDNKSLHIHLPQENLSAAENFLYMIRPNSNYEPIEAQTLDLALILHAEHGGGNNSSFTTHVVTSSGTDTYSAICAAMCSLKGPKHGGANEKVMAMIEDVKANIKNWQSEDEISEYISKIFKKEAFDKSGLVYGFGHAVYTLSDPRTIMLKQKAAELAKVKGMEEEYNLYLLIEKLVPAMFAESRNNTKTICTNVDFYSGFVYKMLDIPSELYTPLFAMARTPGWCAHRIEELVSGGKIIRPAYKNILKRLKYTKLSDR